VKTTFFSLALYFFNQGWKTKLLYKDNSLPYLQILLLVRSLWAPTTPTVHDSLQIAGLWSIQPRYLWLTVRGEWWWCCHGGIRDGLALYAKCFSATLKINSQSTQHRTVFIIKDKGCPQVSLCFISVLEIQICQRQVITLYKYPRFPSVFVFIFFPFLWLSEVLLIYIR